MSKRIMFMSYLTCFIAAVFIIGGCNIFDFTSDAEKSPTEKAEDAIRDGKYSKAKEELAPAVRDSIDSMSLYLDAKATLLQSGMDLATLIDLIESDDDINDGDNLDFLDTIDGMPDAEKTVWYDTNMEIRSNLARIYKGKTTGVLEKDDITLGYTVSNMVSGVLGLRDTNRDGVIDQNDFQIDLSFVENINNSNVSGFQITGAKVKDEQGNVIQDQQLEGLTVFLGDWQGKIVSAHKTAKGGKYEPDDINPLVAYVMSLLEDGAESIVDLLVDEDSTAYEVDKIERQINDIAEIINYYWYDDGIDNDGDGIADEEQINGIDDDGDGLIDEDTEYHSSDPTTEENTEYIEIWRAWNNR